MPGDTDAADILEPDADVVQDIEALREAGAAVVTGEGTTTEVDVQRAEAQLGFALPEPVRRFWLTMGHIKVTCERTWNFYGVDEALARTELYRPIFDDMRDDSYASYYPKRFVVLFDEGDFDNEGWGTVYDADLDALLVTYGVKWNERGWALSATFDDLLYDQLAAIQRRIEDPADKLVAGGDRDRAMRSRAREEGKTSASSDAEVTWQRALDRVYATFGRDAAAFTAVHCYQGSSCEDCAVSNAAVQATPLRDVTWADIEHLVYYGLVTTDEDKQAYKHVLPKVLEVLDEAAITGPYVVDGIFRTMAGAGLDVEEDAVVEAFLRAHFARLLENTSTTKDELGAFLYAVANRRPAVEPYLDAWTTALQREAPLRHAEIFAEAHNFDFDAKDHGWPEAPFTSLRRWLRSGAIDRAREALDR